MMVRLDDEDTFNRLIITAHESDVLTDTDALTNRIALASETYRIFYTYFVTRAGQSRQCD